MISAFKLLICLTLHAAGTRNPVFDADQPNAAECRMLMFATCNGNLTNSSSVTNYTIDDQDNSCPICYETLINLDVNKVDRNHSHPDTADAGSSPAHAVSDTKIELLIRCPLSYKHAFHPVCFGRYYMHDSTKSGMLCCPCCRTPCYEEFQAYVEYVFKQYYCSSDEAANSSREFFSVILPKMKGSQLRHCFSIDNYDFDELEKLERLFKTHANLGHKINPIMKDISKRIAEHRAGPWKILSNILEVDFSNTIYPALLGNNQITLAQLISLLNINSSYDDCLAEDSSTKAGSTLLYEMLDLENRPASLDAFVKYILKFTKMDFSDRQIARMISLCFKWDYVSESLAILKHAVCTRASCSKMFEKLCMSKSAKKLFAQIQHANWTKEEIIKTIRILGTANSDAIMHDFLKTIDLEDADMFELLKSLCLDNNPYVIQELVVTKGKFKITVDQAIDLIEAVVDKNSMGTYDTGYVICDCTNIASVLNLETSRYIDVLRACLYKHKHGEAVDHLPVFAHRNICAESVVRMMNPETFQPDMECLRLIILSCQRCVDRKMKEAILNHMGGYFRYESHEDIEALWKLVTESKDIDLLYLLCQKYSREKMPYVGNSDIIRILNTRHTINAAPSIISTLIKMHYIVPENAIECLVKSNLHKEEWNLCPIIKNLDAQFWVGNKVSACATMLGNWLAKSTFYSYVAYLVPYIDNVRFFDVFSEKEAYAIIKRFIRWKDEAINVAVINYVSGNSVDPACEKAQVLSLLVRHRLFANHFSIVLGCLGERGFNSHFPVFTELFFRNQFGQIPRCSIDVPALYTLYMDSLNSQRTFALFYKHCSSEDVKYEMSYHIARNIIISACSRFNAMKRPSALVGHSKQKIKMIVKNLTDDLNMISYLRVSGVVDIIDVFCEKEDDRFLGLLNLNEYCKLRQALRPKHAPTLLERLRIGLSKIRASESHDAYSS